VTTHPPGATPTGVPAPSLASMIEVPKVAEVELGNRPPASSPDARDAIEDEAAKKIAEARKAEFGHIAVPVPDGVPEEPAEPAPEPVADEPAPAEPVAPVAPPAPQTIRIMVNGQPQDIPADAKMVIKIEGQEREVTVAEGIRINQLEGAARKRLEEATARRAEAERVLEQAGRQTPPAAPAAPASPPTPQAPSIDDVVDQAAKAVLHGSEDEIKAVLRKILTPAPAQPVQTLTAEQIQQIAQSTYRQEHQQQRLEETFGEIAAKHQAVFADERLGAAVAAQSSRMMREDLIEAGADPVRVNAMPQEQIAGWHAKFRNAVDFRGRSLETIFRTAAEDVENTFVRPKESPVTPTTPPATQQRLDAKRGAPPVPAAATARPTPKVATRKTASQIVAEDQRERAYPR